MSFDLFGKPPTSAITVEDLQRLISDGTREGYSVEYKEIPQDNGKIARVLSSLANTHGGWYFVGIDDDTNDAACSLTGYRQSEHPELISRIRNVARDRISPQVLIYPQIVQIDAHDADVVVLAVYVPDGQDTPFITREGVVFHRNHASCEPVQVTDRLTMDRLIEQGNAHLNRFEQFCRDERSFEHEYEPAGRVSFFFWPYPLGIIERPEIVERAGIATAIKQSKHTGIESGRDMRLRLPADFQYGHPSIQSSIFRGQNEEPNPGGIYAPRWVSMELFTDGRAKLHIPLRYRDLHPTTLNQQIRHFRLQDVLAGAFERGLIDYHTKFAELVDLWSHTAAKVAFYLNWLGDAANGIEIRFCISIEHVWNHAAIADNDIYGSHIGSQGIPVLQVPSIHIPRERGWGGVMPSEPLAAVRLLCESEGLAFGLPSVVSNELFELMNFQPY